MNWVVPSEAWANEVRTIMDTFNVSMQDAARMLGEHHTADAVFDHLTEE